jgi:hypothetical protein
MEQRMTNEQKLEEIYQIVTAAESRRKSMMWLRIGKWLIILSLVYLVYSNPQAIMGRVTDIIKPMVLSTASGMIETQKAELSKSLKDLLPAGVELQ